MAVFHTTSCRMVTNSAAAIFAPAVSFVVKFYWPGIEHSVTS